MVTSPPSLIARASRFGGRLAKARWLVLAPHPDDETLGAGALIAEASDGGRLAGVVFVTDGSGSHPCVDASARRRLAELRRQEAREALRALTRRADTPIEFLDWRDARPPDPGSPTFLAAARRLSGLCRRGRVDAIAVTALRDAHCDHVASAKLAYAVARDARRRIDVLQYAVWSDPADLRDARFLAIDARSSLPRRAAALARHRSQLTPSAGQGFRLSPEQRDLRRRPFEFFLRSAPRHAS